MNSLTQNLLRIIVISTGLVAILAPVVHILVTSRHTKSRSVGSGSGFRRWPAILFITTIFLGTGILLWKPLPLSITTSTRYQLSWVGFVIYLPAISLYLWGFLTLGRQFGVSSLTGADLYSGHQLIKKGPYHFVRHPMYLAVILAALGAFLFFLTWAMLVLLPLSLVVIARAHQEEKLMEAEYGDEWQAYKKQVPMWTPRMLKK